MMGANSETQLSENQLSDEQSRSVAAIVREELARAEIERIRDALVEAELLGEKAKRDAA